MVSLEILKKCNIFKSKKNNIPLVAADLEAAAEDVLSFVAVVVQLADEKVSCSRIQIQGA